MSRELERLAARKQLLQARASVQRLEAAYEVATLREATRLPRTVSALLMLPPVRGLLITGLVVLVRKIFRK